MIMSIEKGLVSLKDDKYPNLLKELKAAPKELYYKGQWSPELFENCLAVVGTRRPTSYGRKITKQVVEMIASAGITIVSGFMYGIDAEAHEAALRTGGRTIAVMACGIDSICPEHQSDLYDRILNSGGLVISEYEGKHPAANWTFPQRNRIVAGLSKATLVVEAGEKSGSLITANIAKKLGRKIFVVPHQLTNPGSRGVMALYKSGAQFLSSSRDILDFYNIPFVAGTVPAAEAGYDEDGVRGRIFEVISHEPTEADELARKLGIEVSKLNSELSLMEIEGLIYEEEGKYHVKLGLSQLLE